MFVACHQESRGIPADHSVRQQDIQELGHVSHFLLEDSAVHYKHNRSGEMSERESDDEKICDQDMISIRSLVTSPLTDRVMYMC